eukprot:Opistho-2@45182
MASQFNDPGMNSLYYALMKKITDKTGIEFLSHLNLIKGNSEKIYIIPPDRTRYLAEIAEANRDYNVWVAEQVSIAQKMYQLKGTIDILEKEKKEDGIQTLKELYN